MKEIEFRIEALKRNIEKFNGKRIALYGIKDNAKSILEEFPEQNIIALIDEKKVGKYAYGKLVIELEDVLALGIEVIIIAAEMLSSVIVSKRILTFCEQNHILLLNMYGKEEQDLKKNLLVSKCNYYTYDEVHLQAQIERNEIICVQLMDVLCNLNFANERHLFEAFEEKYGLVNFVENRISAEKQRTKISYGLQDIYKCYATLVYPNTENIKELCEKEEQFWLDNLVPHKKMIEIINLAAESGKQVYVVSDLKISWHNVSRLFEVLGLKNCKNIIQPNFGNKSFSNGALRFGLGKEFWKKTLYIGTEGGYNIMLAMSYDMEIVLLKSMLELVRDISDINIDREGISEEERESFHRYMNKKADSLFVKDFVAVPDAVTDVADTTTWKKKNQDQLAKELYAAVDTTDINSLPKILLPKTEQPRVSIIIPVYNQFGYTYNCLRSIVKNTIGIPYEVIIADDCSSDETREIENVVVGTKYLRNDTNLMFLRNCNQAAKTARGEYIVFLNNDTQVLYNWLAPMVHLMDTDAAIGMVGAKLIYPDGTLQEAGGIIWSDGRGANYGRGDNPNSPEFCYVKEVDYISGAAIMIRKALWQEIGGFDERFAPAYCEDSDLAFEVRKRGKRVVFQPASKVVHYEGVSNGAEITTGVKKYQVENQDKLEEKWRETLQETHYFDSKDIFRARERKGKRKTVLFLSNSIPTPDQDAGSVTVFNYLKLFVKKGYLVKFVAADFINRTEYSFVLEQMGIEVLCSDYYEKNLDAWILQHEEDIEFAFVHYPKCGEKFMDLLKATKIKILYYGHDLHYLRKQREYELSGAESDLKEAKANYITEKKLIAKADMVYYPSAEEENRIRKEFAKESVKAIPAYIFENAKCGKNYCPENRKGIMYIGGYNHSPNVDAVLWFAKEIYPKISAEGEIPFYIVGSNEPPEVRKLIAPGIIHKGYVTDSELQELYAEVKMVMVPLRYGAGVKGKVIEAMHQGVPMVSTTVGIEGIQEAEQYIAVADDADVFAKKVKALYYDDEKLRNTSERYATLIEKYFSEDAVWEVIKKDFD